MIHRSVMLLSLLALAACGKSGDEKAGKAEEVAAPAPKVAEIKLKPGAWDATTEIVSMEIAGLDPAMFKGNVGRKTEFKNCVTPEQAERPPADFFAHPDVKNGNCKSERFAMAGGKLDAEILCQAAQGQGAGGPMRMTMAGNYGPDAYDMTVTMNGEGGPNGGAMKMVVRSSGKHVGDTCEADRPS
ncbi:hypothetical protein ACFB49_38830 [Sphingomonas sp. DBB INV C78]|uniref:DUF3617 domain-containing protein n=1 Tax=Sphingomonas sp. DBB INV C78 TaxID=3349434 RepID=UPI0036D3A8A0